MLRLDVLSFPRAALFASLMVTGCRYMYGEPAPIPIELANPPPALPPEPCERLPDPMVPLGKTLEPTTEGELSLVDVRGDDRLAIQGYVVFTWSKDGEKLISASQDGVMFWNAATGVLERRIPIPNKIESPLRVLLSPDERWVAFVAYMEREDQSRIEAPGVFLMRADGEGLVRRFEQTGDTIWFTADSGKLASLSQQWEVDKNVVTTISPPHLEHEAKFLPGYEIALVFIPEGNPGSQKVFPELYDTVNSKTLHRFPLIDTSIGSGLSGDGKRLALLSNGVLTVYSTETYEVLVTLPNVGKAQMVHLSHDGKRAVTEVLMCAVALSSDAKDMSWCPKPELILWDLEKKEKLLQTPAGSGSQWEFTPDGEYLTGPETRLVDYIVRVRDGKELRFGSRIRSISPGSHRVLYDGKLGFEIAALDGTSPVPVMGHSPRVWARSADGRLHVVSGNDGRMRLESETSCLKLPLVVPSFGEPRSNYEYFADGDSRIGFSADGASLFVSTFGGSSRALFRVFDTRTGKERWSRHATNQGGGVVQVLPQANQVLFQGHEHPELRRFNATTGEELAKGGMPRVVYYAPAWANGQAFEVRRHDGIRSPYLYGVLARKNGTSLGMAGTLENKCAFSFWDVRNPRNVEDIFPGCMSGPKALSPDEKWIAAGSTEGRGMLLAWGGAEVRLINGMHEGKTTAVAFTPRGDRFVLADDRGNIVIAGAPKGSVTGRARLPLDYAKSLWISPDSETIVADTARGMQVRLRIANKTTK